MCLAGELNELPGRLWLYDLLEMINAIEQVADQTPVLSGPRIHGAYNVTQLRCDLNSALARTSASTGRNAIPAATVIPVAAMKMAPAEGKPILALQLLAVDAPHLETEMWIHHNRSYE